MSKVTSFVFGGILGATAVFFLTSRTGAENRAFVAEKVDAFVDGRRNRDNFVSFDPEEEEEEEYCCGGGTATSNSDIREKLEAARERIANQMNKNVSAAQDAIRDVAPAAANKVSELAEAAAEKVVGFAEGLTSDEDVAEDSEDKPEEQQEEEAPSEE